MSFDTFFQTARFDGSVAVKKNPFTGASTSVPITEPLSSVELKAVRKVLKEVGIKDKHGFYAVSFPDGGAAEVCAEEPATGCMVALRRITPDLTQFLFELLQAGNWVMLPAMAGNVALTTSPESIKGVPKDFPEIIMVNNADEVGVVLSNGVQGWQKYRDKLSGK